MITSTIIIILKSLTILDFYLYCDYNIPISEPYTTWLLITIVLKIVTIKVMTMVRIKSENYHNFNRLWNPRDYIPTRENEISPIDRQIQRFILLGQLHLLAWSLMIGLNNEILSDKVPDVILLNMNSYYSSSINNIDFSIARKKLIKPTQLLKIELFIVIVINVFLQLKTWINFIHFHRYAYYRFNKYYYSILTLVIFNVSSLLITTLIVFH